MLDISTADSEQAKLAELQRCAGMMFDPKIVNLFLQIIGQQSTEEIEEIDSSPEMAT